MRPQWSLWAQRERDIGERQIALCVNTQIKIGCASSLRSRTTVCWSQWGILPKEREKNGFCLDWVDLEAHSLPPQMQIPNKKIVWSFIMSRHVFCVSNFEAALTHSLSLNTSCVTSIVRNMWCNLSVNCSGHGSFSNNKTLNDLVGNFVHSSILVPYHGWRISHRTHHQNHGHVENDESWHPINKDLYDTMVSFALLQIFLATWCCFSCFHL